MKSNNASDSRGAGRRTRVWIALALLGATGLVWQARSDTASKPDVPATASVRTARVRTGTLERTLRVTGVIAPQRFASLLAPQLRGTRGGPRGGGGGGGGGGSSSGSSGGSSSGSSSSSSSGGSSGSSGSSSGSSGGGQTSGDAAQAAAGGASATAGAGAGMSSASGTSALRNALSRFGSSGSSSSSSRSGSSRSTSSSGSGLGSTASSLGRGGGLGPSTGGGEFNLILQTAVAPGAKVGKGQVIAEFDRLNMLTRLDDFKVNLTEQEKSLKTLEVNLDVTRKSHLQSITSAKAALDKAELDLKTVPVQSDIQAEHLKLAAEEARARYKQLLTEVKFKEASQAAQLKIARLDFEESKVQLQRIEANTEKMILRAPIDGVVVMGTTFRGSEFGQIRAGDEVHPGSMVMRVVDPDSMIVEATVNQVDIENIRIGMKARVRIDAYPDMQLPAHIYSVGAVPKTGGARAAFVKEIPVTLKLEKMDPRVIPDLSVSVDIIVDHAPDSTIAPIEAVFRDSPAGKPFVYVRGASGWERREVEVGTTSNVAAVIRSGVRPGEIIAAEWPVQEKRK